MLEEHKLWSRSPWHVEEIDGKFYLCCEDEPIKRVIYMKRPSYCLKSTSKGTMAAIMALQRGYTCLFISPLNYCQYFKGDNDCKFCAFNPAWEKYQAVGAKPIPDPDEIREVIEWACEEYPIDHIKLCGGSLYDTHKEAEIYGKVAEVAHKAAPHVRQIDMVCQAYTKDDFKMLYDKGVVAVCADLEIWQEHLWPEIVPGKHKAVGYKEWIKRMCEGLDVFGEYNVATNLVGGVETVPESGFKRWEDAVDDTAKGLDWLVRNGIEPTVSVWFATPGSKYEDEETAPTEYHLALNWRLLESFKNMPGALEKIGYKKLGMDPPRRTLCYRCCFDNLWQDYPRLVENEEFDDEGFLPYPTAFFGKYGAVGL
jgi:hypothetical protein